MDLTSEQKQRFFAKVEMTGSCWLWFGSLNNKGYGSFSVSGKDVLAHRVSVALAGRYLDQRLVVDHLCRVRHCVNPDHLELVTSAENSRRGFGWLAPMIKRMSKTHCKYGHILNSETIYVHPTKLKRGIYSTECRICRNKRNVIHNKRSANRKK